MSSSATISRPLFARGPNPGDTVSVLLDRKPGVEPKDGDTEVVIDRFRNGGAASAGALFEGIYNNVDAPLPGPIISQAAKEARDLAVKTYPVWKESSVSPFWNRYTPLDLRAELQKIDPSVDINPVNLRLVRTSSLVSTQEVEYNPSTKQIRNTSPNTMRNDGFLRSAVEYTQFTMLKNQSLAAEAFATGNTETWDFVNYESVPDLDESAYSGLIEKSITWATFKNDYEGEHCKQLFVIESPTNVRLVYYDDGAHRTDVWLPTGERLYDKDLQENVSYRLHFIQSALDYLPRRIRKNVQIDPNTGTFYHQVRRNGLVIDKPVQIDIAEGTYEEYEAPESDECAPFDNVNADSPSIIRRTSDLLTEYEWRLWSTARKDFIYPTVQARKNEIKKNGDLTAQEINVASSSVHLAVSGETRRLIFNPAKKDFPHILGQLEDDLVGGVGMDNEFRIDEFFDQLRYLLDDKEPVCEDYLKRLKERWNLKSRCMEKKRMTTKLNAQMLGAQQLLLPVMIPFFGPRRRITVAEATAAFPRNNLIEVQQWNTMLNNHRHNALFLHVAAQIQKLVFQYVSVLAEDMKAGFAGIASQQKVVGQILVRLAMLKMPKRRKAPSNFIIPQAKAVSDEECRVRLQESRHQLALLKQQLQRDEQLARIAI